MERGCYMASIEIKDAYFSFAINSHDKKFLCFQWENQIYQFSSLPNGLFSAPRKFTKLLKVPLSQLHKQGHISLGHLDDFYLQETIIANASRIYLILSYCFRGLD